MNIDAIVEFWRGEQQVDKQGCWSHRLDRNVLHREPHSFILDHPVSPYIGDILNAPVIILNANAGYKKAFAPSEFPDDEAIQAYLRRVDEPSNTSWSFVSEYYDKTNYGHLLASGKAALINACAYRSPKISQEPDNKKMIGKLPSCTFTRRWLLEAVLPLAHDGERLIVVNRGGLWNLPPAMRNQSGVAYDPAPVSPLITSTALQAMTKFLEGYPAD